MELKEGFKQTEIGAIPEDWEVKQIGDYSFITKLAGFEYTLHFDYKISGDIIALRALNIKNGYLKLKDVQTIPKKTSDFLKRSKLKKGDLVVSYVGTVGEMAVIPVNNKFHLAPNVAKVDVDRKNISPFFINQYYNSSFGKNEILKLVASTTQSALSMENLRKVLFPFPPTIEEQKQIANILNDTDQLIQNIKNLIAKKKAIKQGAMQELLSGKKRLQGFTEEWETKKLGEIAFIKTGSKNNQDKISDGNFPFFVRSQFVERINTYSYDCEAILVPGEGGIGSIFHYINGKFDVHQRVYVINDFSQNVFGKYVYLFMKEHFGTHAMKNSVKATVDSLRLPTFQEFEIKIPKDIQEQQSISQILSDMDAEIEALEQQLQKTQALKQGMMQELLTGKIRLVKPATKEKTEPLAMVAEPAVVYNKKAKPKRHNEHINDAVLIGTMANVFGSDKFPLTRFMYTKVSYLLKRYKEEETLGYLKKAAGPYKPKTRYGGAEKIALQNRYVKKHISKYKGKKYENFLAGDNVTEAINYFKDWYGENALQWIEQFKYVKRNQLELWATVDMAIEDLKIEEKSVNFGTVKELINNHKEWRPKLKRPIFSDSNIKEAINKVNQLFL